MLRNIASVSFIANSNSHTKSTTRKSLRNYHSTNFVNQDVGFIGLGQMGYRMAQNIVKSGRSIVVYDVSQETAQKFKDEVEGNVTIASSPKEVAEQGDVVVTVLPSSPHVQEVYLNGEGNLMSGAKKDQLFIDASTIDPVVSAQVHNDVSGHGCKLLDAPISGGINGARDGTLTFMVGGAEESFNTAKPLLEAMGKNIVHCGKGGNGQVAKVCNNLILGITMVGVSEAMNLGVKLGINPEILAQIVNTSSGRCWSSDTYNPVPGIHPNVPASNNYQGGFQVNLMHKDLGLALSAAQQIKEPLPLGANAYELYTLLASKGYGKLDFSSVYKFLNEN
eukprot:TRINITY_DN10410_c0_g1_i1.p1 TRINITY_DN10410_c0_g1~~TRINITY_DN10410_c0_g1_i1.p1  ORF type:complete len:335 (-),score=85.93 TRINITY_DN10410_c0_g1_i1:22-1026(-)